MLDALSRLVLLAELQAVLLLEVKHARVHARTERNPQHHFRAGAITIARVAHAYAGADRRPYSPKLGAASREASQACRRNSDSSREEFRWLMPMPSRARRASSSHRAADHDVAILGRVPPPACSGTHDIPSPCLAPPSAFATYAPPVQSCSGPCTSAGRQTGARPAPRSRGGRRRRGWPRPNTLGARPRRRPPRTVRVQHGQQCHRTPKTVLALRSAPLAHGRGGAAAAQWPQLCVAASLACRPSKRDSAPPVRHATPCRAVRATLAREHLPARATQAKRNAWQNSSEPGPARPRKSTRRECFRANRDRYEALCVVAGGSE
eukprot:4459907-Prymnesium_polylepis.2